MRIRRVTGWSSPWRARAAAGVLLLAAALATLAVTGAGRAQAQEPVLRLGAAIALTGPVSREGNFVKDGYDFWVRTVNDRGGIAIGGQRYRVEIKYYDDESKAETAARLTEKLITDDKVAFVLGPFSSAIFQATSTISERYRVVTIAPQANADTIYERGYRYIFSILPPASTYLRGLIDMAAAATPRPTRMAIMIRDDPFGIAAGEGAARYAEQRGFQVVFKERYPANATDVSSVLTQVKALNPEVFLATTLFQDALLITKQAKELQFAPRIMGFTAGPAIPDFVRSLGADANYIYGSEWWLPTLKYCGEAPFGCAADYATAIERWKGYTPGYHTASGTMAGLVLQLALQAAGRVDGEAVRQALLGLAPRTFWGPIGWNEQGKNVRGTSVPVQIQNQRVVAVWPPEARVAAPIYPMPAWTAR
jgi:branched-chain amino acid transport system substrate-binding protein